MKKFKHPHAPWSYVVHTNGAVDLVRLVHPRKTIFLFLDLHSTQTNSASKKKMPLDSK